MFPVINTHTHTHALPVSPTQERCKFYMNHGSIDDNMSFVQLKICRLQNREALLLKHESGRNRLSDRGVRGKVD